MKKLTLSLLIVITSTIGVFASYNKTAAVNYALNHVYSHNSNYLYYPNANCTNFVSQALRAGGFSYDRYGSGDFRKWYKYSPSWQWAPTLRKRFKYGGFRSVKVNYNDIVKGDIVFFAWPDSDRFTHAAIVTKVNFLQNCTNQSCYEQEVFVTYNSTDRKNKSLFDMPFGTIMEYYHPR